MFRRNSEICETDSELKCPSEEEYVFSNIQNFNSCEGISEDVCKKCENPPKIECPAIREDCCYEFYPAIRPYPSDKIPLNKDCMSSSSGNPHCKLCDLEKQIDKKVLKCRQNFEDERCHQLIVREIETQERICYEKEEIKRMEAEEKANKLQTEMKVLRNIEGEEKDREKQMIKSESDSLDINQQCEENIKEKEENKCETDITNYFSNETIQCDLEKKNQIKSWCEAKDAC